MNPPSALYGAMNKERKPFTYTPGGLDLSEIKSERMAKRLMRNAMNEGVPEIPSQTLQSPPIPVTPSAMPNFNCLPVQVFPTFPLPANPKSLLRTRSISDAPKEIPAPKLPTGDNLNTNSWKDVNKPSLFSIDNDSNIHNNNRPTSKYEYDYKTITDSPSINFKNQDNIELFLPEKCYDAEYCRIEPQGRIKVVQNKNSDDILQSSIPIYGTTTTTKSDNNISLPLTLASLPLQDIDATKDYEQKEVKVVKKQSKSETKSEQNGDTEAALVVKLPKSSAAKTETKVEVLKKILPDGTIEEIKTTTTKTTKDGKTEITTETETRTIPKEGAEDVIEVDEEEEEEEEGENVIIEDNGDEGEVVVQSKISNENEIEKSTENGEGVVETGEVVTETAKTDVKENGDIITEDEKIESSSTKKIVVTQTDGESEEEVLEEEEEVEVEEDDGTNVDVEEVVILKKPESKQNEEKTESVQDNNVEQDGVEKIEETEEQEDEVEEEEENEDEIVKTSATDVEKVEREDVDSDIEETPLEENNDEEEEKKLIEEDPDEEYEEAEDTQHKAEVETESNEEKQDIEKTESQIKEVQEVQNETETTEMSLTNEDKKEEIPVPKLEPDKQQVSEETVHKIPVQLEPKVSFREPSIPLEKVEDIEIKPIGPAQEIIKKSHTEIITTTTDKPEGALSTQTEYNRIENIVTVNRTTKTLDAYEPNQQTIPTLKTYFSPINDRVLSTPQPTTRPYQPGYSTEPQPERRHSLLLERLSVDRQIPTTDYSIYNNQNYEQNQWSEEPQSEVLTVSNVKPSTITKNQQWYQQTKRENIIPSAISPSPIIPSQQQQKPQPQQQWGPLYQHPYNPPQPQAQVQPEPQYQTYAQPQYNSKPEYQPYVEKSTQNTYKSTNDFQQNVYPTYTPKPSWVSSTFDSKPANLAPLNQSNQYSSFKKDATESYQTSTQQFSSSYVPPPWEQDSSYVTENQNYYQPPPPSSSFTPNINQSWKSQNPTNKFSKAPPTSYIPPAPNQSFVKPVTSNDQTKLSGRKTYYSEYERRYISVPESTYIPSETKFQPQPDPSPQYYYDNNEPVETVEPQWRKELREFTEKTSETTTQYEKTTVKPPWEEDPRYAAPSDYAASTPSWTQTLRPRTWRERSYEPEYIGSKEWPKTNTLGRGRPQSSYIKSNVETIQERPRGVSVDRYNPNNYQSPLSSEHPPVQSHTLNPTVYPKTYHNPNVPGYHARASAEPREQVTTYPRRVESKAPPVQSRSFKYLQWITGTED